MFLNTIEQFLKMNMNKINIFKRIEIRIIINTYPNITLQNNCF